MKSKEASGYYQRPEVKAKRNEDSRLHKKAMYMFDEDYRINELIRCHERRKQTGVNKLSTEEWLEALERFNYSCAYCGSNTKLSMDHIIPISIGGTNEASNIIPACSSCNFSKQASDMVEWYTTQVFYSKKRLENIIKYSKSRR
jgi:5-methylcytosine-specific restriction endonuclease McrA